mmetsp:Transcript_18678/g.44314  ORF Transcript_18678/g.44314 Transcript_18678/m.44314 type:complete len:246 (-) Transcript_18678:1734-2471(-)
MLSLSHFNRDLAPLKIGGSLTDALVVDKGVMVKDFTSCTQAVRVGQLAWRGLVLHSYFRLGLLRRQTRLDEPLDVEDEPVAHRLLRSLLLWQRLPAQLGAVELRHRSLIILALFLDHCGQEPARDRCRNRDGHGDVLGVCADGREHSAKCGSEEKGQAPHQRVGETHLGHAVRRGNFRHDPHLYVLVAVKLVRLVGALGANHRGRPRFGRRVHLNAVLFRLVDDRHLRAGDGDLHLDLVELLCKE